MRVPRTVLVRCLVAAIATLGLTVLGTASALAAPVKVPVTAGPTHSGAVALRLRILSVHGREVRVVVWTTRGTERRVVIDVRRGRTLVASARLATVSPRRRPGLLTVRRGVSIQDASITVTATGHRI